MLDDSIRGDKAAVAALKGKTVVITGASSGIGLVTAVQVAKAGGIPILVARGVEKLASTKALIESQGGEAHAYACDLSDLEAIDALTKDLSEDFATIDFVVNNAGRSIRRSLKLSEDRFHDFERTMQLNYFGAIRLVMGILPKMREQGSGHIVNISSIGVLTNPPRFSAYVASKAALDAWSNVVSSEVFGDGISFTSIHMPLVRTPMIAPTKIYDRFPTISPGQAARKVITALVEKPHEINTLTGNIGALGHTLAPKAAFRVLHMAYQVFPDSAAARGRRGGGREVRVRAGPAGPPAQGRALVGNDGRVKIFHIATLADWTAAKESGAYTTSTLGRTLEEEGFIHASRREQVAGVHKSFYSGSKEPLVLLTIDTAKLTSELREDEVGDDTFPHIYGPLNVDAVVATQRLNARGGTESFTGMFMGEMFVRMIVVLVAMLLAFACSAALDSAWGSEWAALVGAVLGLAGGALVYVLVQRRRNRVS